jgi:hypothetical protein
MVDPADLDPILKDGQPRALPRHRVTDGINVDLAAFPREQRDGVERRTLQPNVRPTVQRYERDWDTIADVPDFDFRIDRHDRSTMASPHDRHLAPKFIE